MGADLYFYYIPYQKNVSIALNKLREQVFQSGQFRGSELSPKNMKKAFENMEAEGTGSILDIHTISKTPDYCTASPMSQTNLYKYFGTDKPSREMITNNQAFIFDIERGHAIYIIIFKNNAPNEIYFAGLSFD